MEKALINFVDTMIGIPYKINGREKDGMDCFGVVLYFFKHYLGIDLCPSLKEVPEEWYHNPEYEEYKIKLLVENGEMIKEPEMFCVVLMSPSPDDKIDHIGVFIGDDLVLNTGKNKAKTNRLSRLIQARRVRGFMHLKRQKQGKH